MKHLKFLILIMILMLSGCVLTGCFEEYMRKPDEISVEIHAWETNYGWLGKAPTYGLTLGGAWKLAEKGGE